MRKFMLVVCAALFAAISSFAVSGDFYDSLPFPDIYPLPAGPVLVNGAAKRIKLGFAQTAFNHPWRIEMNNSVQAEVDRHPNVEVVLTDGNVDVAKQHSDIEDLLSQGCDAIIMSPIDSAALANAARKVMERAVPLVVLDRDVYADKTVFIGQSNYAIGQQLGDLLVKVFDGEANVVEITGLKGTAPAIDRQRGFRDAIKDHPGIKVIAEGDGEFLREPASKLMDDFLIAHDDIDAVYSHAEESAWGADLAIRRAGRAGDGIRQFTIDASNAGFRSVKSGQFTADGNYTPHIGQVGVRAALYVLMGKELDGLQKYEYGSMRELPELPVVDAANVDEWIGRGWGE
jgi:ribose transport system substrate-binding protein